MSKINYFYYKGKLYFKIRYNSPIRIVSKDEIFSNGYTVYNEKTKVNCFSGTFEDLQNTYPTIFKDKRKVGFDSQLESSKAYNNITTLREFKEYIFNRSI